MSRKLILLVAAIVTLAGCTKKEEAPEGPRPTTTVEPAAVEAPAAAVNAAEASGAVNADDDPSVVVADDLKDKATEEISGANLEKQLDALEKEIGKSE